MEKNKLYREKIDLENQLEAEQEYIMNKLQKQVLMRTIECCCVYTLTPVLRRWKRWGRRRRACSKRNLTSSAKYGNIRSTAYPKA